MIFQKRETADDKPDLTPMIDIIFQLLIFFVLTAKFIATEEQLQAYLPKDRGLSSSTPQLDEGVKLFLAWEDPKVVCRTVNYRMGNTAQQQYTFPDDPNGEPDGAGGFITNTVRRSGSVEGKVTYDHVAPDFGEIEAYLQGRRDAFPNQADGLPVEVDYGDAVPWQMVVNILDICQGLGIRRISFSGKEIEIP